MKKRKPSRSRSARPRKRSSSKSSLRSRTSKLQRIFRHVLAFARKKYPGTPSLELRIGCPDIKRARRRGNPRAYFHVGAHPGKVCTVAEVAALDESYLVGLMLHEISHLIAAREWGRSDQIDADEASRRFLGVQLEYRGALLLQWVPGTVVGRILAGGHVPNLSR